MNSKIFIIAISTLLVFSNIVFALPTQSHQFYGSVTINGASAPDGTTVSAKINGVEVASTTTVGGKYGLFEVPDTDPASRSGLTINFFVNDVDTGKTISFCNACFNDCGTESLGCAPLDLAITTSTSDGSSSGSSSGGSVGGTTSTVDTTDSTTSTDSTTQDEVCQERWTCSKWGECINGIQTRVCADENNCGTNSREPFTSQPCSAAEAEEASAGPTGFFLLSPTNIIIGSIVGVAVAALIIFFILRRNSKSVPVVIATY